MKLYTALSTALKAEGVEVVFGLIAGNIDEVIRDLVEDKKIRYVQVRHEEVAIGMADGYSRASGKIGVAIIDGGPGLANACAPLMAARMSGSRVLAIISKTEGIDRHTYDLVNRFNNMSYDQAPLLAATIGTWQSIRSTATLSDDVARAFRHIRLGRGPIALTFDSSLAPMPENWEYASSISTEVSSPVVAPRAEDIEAVADMIRSARHPLVLAGRGAWQAGAKTAISELADRSGALITTSLLGTSLFDGDPYFLGVSGGYALADARPIMKQADLVVAFGTQLSLYTLGHGQLYGGAKLVQIDLLPDAIGEYFPVDKAVVADARLAAEALSRALGQQIERPDWRGAAMAERISGFDRWRDRDMTEREGRANIRRVVDAIDRLAPKDRMVCIDIGLFMGPPGAYMHVPAPDAQIFPWQLGRVGVGLPVAAGAALGRPDRLMICFVGDGGMMAAMNALDTLRIEQIPILLVVMDDDGYGADRYIFEMRQERTRVADAQTPDLVAIATAYGIKAHRVTSGAEMEQVMNTIGPVTEPILVHVLMDYDVPAQEMDFALYKPYDPH